MLTDEQDRKLARLFHGLHAVRRSLAVSTLTFVEEQAARYRQHGKAMELAEEDEQRLTALYHEHLGRL